MRRNSLNFLAVFAAICVSAAVSGCGGPAETEWPSDLRDRRRDFDDSRAEREEPGRQPSMAEAVRLTEGIHYDSSPCWSPDGTVLAYTSYFGGAQNITVVRLDYHADRLSVIGEQERITEGAFIDREPSWSTEENSIVFSSDRSGEHKLFTADYLTREITELGIEGIQPKWSPRGDRIVFTRGNNIFVAVLNEAIRESPVTRGGYNEFPSWSPDGSSLVFSSGYDIVRTDDRGRDRRILASGGWNSQPDWCLSRDRVVFVSNRGGNYNLWKMNADGSNRVQLTDTPNMERFPRWSRDGRWVAFQADYEGSFDIWAIRVD